MASLITRGSTYYLQYYVGGKIRRRSLGTDSLQLAKEKLRQYESARLRGDDLPLPTRTPLAQIVAAYIEHIRAVKTARSAKKDLAYLRDAFGPLCPALEFQRKRTSEKARLRRKQGVPAAVRLEVNHLEEITTAQVSEFIAGVVQARGLAPKIANRYREILCRLFTWAMDERGLRMPGDKNPVLKVGRYKEPAPEIRFLTLEQIDDQLAALKTRPQLQAMAAMYIYAGLRREEALWLQREDVDFTAGPFGMIRIRAKTVGEESWQLKTKVNRAVPISSTLRLYLDLYAPRPSVGNWYFPSPKGRRYDVDNFSQDLRAANQAAGLPWTCLDYRHTFGSQLAMKGESLYKIATLMGNSPEICRRHYAALVPEAMAGSVEFPAHDASPTVPLGSAKAPTA